MPNLGLKELLRFDTIPKSEDRCDQNVWKVCCLRLHGGVVEREGGARGVSERSSSGVHVRADVPRTDADRALCAARETPELCQAYLPDDGLCAPSTKHLGFARPIYPMTGFVRRLRNT